MNIRRVIIEQSRVNVVICSHSSPLQTALVHAGSQASLTITAVFSSASSASAEVRRQERGV